MNTPVHKDADSDDFDVEIVQSDLDICTWTSDVDEKRRAFVANLMAHADIDGKDLVKNMHLVCEWLRTGKISTDPILKLSKE